MQRRAGTAGRCPERGGASGVGVDVELIEMPHLGHGFDAAWLPDELYRRITVHWLEDRVGRGMNRTAPRVRGPATGVR